jgi:lysophospholipase L1-like esterase
MFRILLPLAFLAAAPAATPLPVLIGGRTIAEADGARTFGWPGTFFEARLRGPAVRVVFDAPEDFLRLAVDGHSRRDFARPGHVDLTLDDLGPGEHIVRLEKLTESQTGGSRFLGFFAANGTAALPAQPRPRRIEFIGDSYTVGYGNLSPTRECTRPQVHDRTDTQQAFGPLVARGLGADYRVNAYSGFGMVRNYAGSSAGLSLPAIYPRLKPDDAAHIDRGDPAWRPQLIVVNLGTNDFSTPLHAGEPWADDAALRTAYRARYLSFVGDLAARQPQARFILMGSDLFYRDVVQVAAALNATRPGRVTTLHFGGLAFAGCDAHPSLADHRVMAGLLRGAVQRSGLGWTEEASATRP